MQRGIFFSFSFTVSLNFFIVKYFCARFKIQNQMNVSLSKENPIGG